MLVSSSGDIAPLRCAVRGDSVTRQSAADCLPTPWCACSPGATRRNTRHQLGAGCKARHRTTAPISRPMTPVYIVALAVSMMIGGADSASYAAQHFHAAGARHHHVQDDDAYWPDNAS